MPKNLNNPSIILLLNEAYEREKHLRAQWVTKHREKILLATQLNREPTKYYEKDVTMACMIGGLATITRDHKAAGVYRRKAPLPDAKAIAGVEKLRHEYSIVNVGAGDAQLDPRLARPDTDLTPDPVMRPVDDKLKKILFKSKPSFGREVYLKERAKLAPDEKYYLSETTNWDYGWRMCDRKISRDVSYGRIWLLNRILHSRVGPSPDPDHYQPPATPNYIRCATNN